MKGEGGCLFGSRGIEAWSEEEKGVFGNCEGTRLTLAGLCRGRGGARLER